MQRPRFIILAALAALFALTASASAQGSKARVSMYSRLEGDQVEIAMRVRIDFHWHLYHDDLGPADAVGLPTKVKLSGEGVEFGPVIFPEPVRYEQKGLGAGGGDTHILGHEGNIVLYAVGTLTDGDELPALSARFDGLTCDEGGSCIPWSATVKSQGRGPDSVFADFPRGGEADGEDTSQLDAGGGAGSGEEKGSGDGLLQEFNLDEETASAMIMAARAHWFEDEDQPEEAASDDDAGAAAADAEESED